MACLGGVAVEAKAYQKASGSFPAIVSGSGENHLRRLLRERIEHPLNVAALPQGLFN